MSDFRVQYVSGSIPAGDTTLTLTAGGGDFSAVSALSRAFILPATTMPTVGLGVNASVSALRAWTTTAHFTAVGTIEVARAFSDGNACDFAFYIIEYTGEAGGHNEFIVRARGEATFVTSSTTLDSAAIAGISNINDCVPFINGRHANLNTTSIRDFLAEARVYNNGVDNVVGFERRLAVNGNPTYVYQVVEFTGDWWFIQQGVTINIPATDKDTAIDALVAVSRAWVHSYFNPANASTPQAATYYTWLTSTTNLRARAALAGSTSRLRWFVIHSIAPSFNVEVVNVVDGVADWIGGDGSLVQTESIPITRPRAGDTFVQGRAGSGSTSINDHPSSVWRFRQSADNTVEARRAKNFGDSEYLVQVVQLPGDSLPPPMRRRHNTLLRM